MDVRGKLVELIGNIYLPMMDGHNTIGEYNIPHKFKEKIADYLISNGVTVQEWISVDDRLPRCGESVIVTDGVFVGEAFLSISHKWVRNGIGWVTSEITHWQPMPELPEMRKAEE